MKRESIKSNYFYGNAISEYGLQHGYVDYRTLSKCGDAVLCNDITKLSYNDIELEQVNGYIDNSDEIDELEREQDYPPEIWQYYIIDDNLAEILKDWTDEIVYYIDYLDIYVWGVTHWGTSWDYVLTNIKIEKDGVEKWK